MSADVSSLMRILNRCYYNDNTKDDHQMVAKDSGKSSSAMITRDFLGESFCSDLDESKELDLDMQVPDGWEKRLDLKSGKVYIQKCSNSANLRQRKQQTTPYSNQSAAAAAASSNLQNLNFSLRPKQSAIEFVEDTSFKLVPSSSLPSSPTSCSNQSVCTLDKVKMALERAQKESTSRKRFSMQSSSSPSNSSSSVRVTQEFEEVSNDDEGNYTAENGLLFAAGCPSCLLYVMISKINPKCPRCHCYVPLPVTKKPRIDLNISL